MVHDKSQSQKSRERKVIIPCLGVAKSRSLGDAILSKANVLVGKVYQDL